MKALIILLLALFGHHQTVNADWQYRSRPDLAPPRLNITIPARNEVEKGYLFIAPFEGYRDVWRHGPLQPGPYIFRDNGDLVWSAFGAVSVWAANFQAARWKGKDILFSFEGKHNPGYGHGHGHIKLLGNDYETIRELRAGNSKISDKHEFHIINEETAVLQVYQPLPRDLSYYGGSAQQQWIVNAIFQELDIEPGKVLYEWASLDHVSPHGQAGSGYNSSDAWDCFHINSVDKDSAGNYLLSARDTCTIYKVKGRHGNGSIVWRLAGKNSSFSLGPGVDFCFQHHARWLEHGEGKDIEIISLYDNSAHGTEHDGGHEVHTAPTSSGKIIRLNTTSWEAELVQAFFPPYKLRSKSQGSPQVLPNGNAVVGWGSEGAVTEFLPNGTAIFHAILESGALAEGVENYRAFRFNWTGYPTEDPAIIALRNGEGTDIYVSWNGDTETRKWKFFTDEDSSGSKFTAQRFLGEAQRKSFETVLHVQESVGSVSADAVDDSGKILRSTGVARVEPNVQPAEISLIGIINLNQKVLMA